ncbi:MULTISPECIES: ribonuclease HIII [Staphylococcus]|uniref:Ribonuclease HIII n=1 Tax=Staphylococcus schleiferi TaxID=1295 RepID=A0A7Z7QQT5_STASC|nr:MULTISPECIES: ribonuclease HIII [Staphylococcus]QGS47238.1 ribonuclease HIII [Mammaliicoccus fleurettii]EPD52476.1 ribonuclease HIII [Staphylococcus sp. HGB0015]MBF1993633.1 ribonuclease HIII [Staphylococcus schleiferi]MBF2037991.1 ribonuclease HIII [Staphylococcus schleiferi]MBF2099717.1 ribonuclease HIII [Staphylococcus schleiferi]
MSNIVVKLSSADIEQLLAQLKPEMQNLPTGMQARAKYKGVTISIYHSKKVMFQGQNAEAIAKQLLGSKANPSSTPSQKQSKSTTSISYNNMSCIGSDEAGSGDYFGPLTVCACFVSKQNIPILKELGVDDSKKLTDAKITELAEQLVTFLPHSLLVLDNPKYNERQSLGWSQVKMKAVLHNECIKNVLEKIDNTTLDYIVIDQFAQPAVYQRYASGNVPELDKTQFETKGESKSLAIAAASIISRYAFVKHMDLLSDKYRMPILKGASHKVDLTAAKIIEKHGIQTLDQISKKHFSNRNKALKLVDAKYNA